MSVLDSLFLSNLILFPHIHTVNLYSDNKTNSTSLRSLPQSLFKTENSIIYVLKFCWPIA